MYKVEYCLIIQVVRYGPNGHYNSHHDTETHERADVPCCHHTDVETVKQYGKCRICRYFSCTKDNTLCMPSLYVCESLCGSECNIVPNR